MCCAAGGPFNDRHNSEGPHRAGLPFAVVRPRLVSAGLSTTPQVHIIVSSPSVTEVMTLLGLLRWCDNLCRPKVYMERKLRRLLMSALVFVTEMKTKATVGAAAKLSLMSNNGLHSSD